MEVGRERAAFICGRAIRVAGRGWGSEAACVAAYCCSQPRMPCFTAGSIAILPSVTVAGTASLEYLMQIELTQWRSLVCSEDGHAALAKR